MYPFKYQRAKSVADAAAVISRDADAKLLAGGQSLVATLKLRLSRPSDLIDLGSIAELRGIKVEGSAVTIGAMTRHADVAASIQGVALTGSQAKAARPNHPIRLSDIRKQRGR